MSRKTLTGLRPQAYEHPLDSAALDVLQDTGGFDTLVRMLNEWGFERIVRVQLTGSNICVTADNFPEIHEKVHEAGAILDLPLLPDIYISGGGEINAFTVGVEKPIMVLTCGAIDQLSDDELLFVIGHELGHIKSSHVLYYQIAQFVPVIGQIIGGVTFGIGELFSAGIQAALLNWKRTSEFTCDRAGLLAVQDANVAISAMMKIAGLPHKYHASVNTEDFIAQARKFEALDTDTLSWIAKGLSIMDQSHPWTVMRAKEILTWVDSGDYEKVLNTPYEHLALHRFCSQCGNAIAGTPLFCSGCGTRLGGAVPAGH